MKPCLLVLFLALSPIFCQAEDAVIPRGYSPDRYEPLWKKSPFTLSSVAEEVQGGFARNLALTGILKIGQKNYVSVFDKESKQRFFLSSEPGAEGIQVEKLETGNELKDVVVTLKKGGEVSTLGYDMSFLKQTHSQAAPQMPVMPVVAPNRIQLGHPPRPLKSSPVRRIIIPSPSQNPPK